MSTVKVDFSSEIGKIKPLHSVNNGAIQGGSSLVDLSEYFKEAGFPYSRLHDTEYPWGKDQFVDIHCVFPDFNADENDPASYNFFFTDFYIKGIIDTGTKVFYRLGESIDHGPKKLYIHPPKDMYKWARICEHIVAHYNEGWAEGYHYGIEYWEIWNEAENPHMWTGTTEQYLELYRITANHLKECFGDKIKVGGYASSGFYYLEPENCNPEYKKFLEFFETFLTYITQENTKAPLDFFSWHIYTAEIEQIMLHANYSKEVLMKYGFAETETILNEWNYIVNWNTEDYYRTRTIEGASFCAAAMCSAQDLPIDHMMYYDATITSHLCGLFNWLTYKPEKTFYAFCAFGKLYRLGTEVKSIVEGEKLYSLAAVSEKGGGILISNIGEERKVNLELSGINCKFKRYNVLILDEEHNLEEITCGDPSVAITFNMKHNNVVYVEFV